MVTTSANGKDAIAETQASSSAARDKLLGDLNSTINEAEKWLSDSAETVSDVASEARVRFNDALSTAKSDLRKLEDSLLAHSRNAADSVDGYVRSNPWQAVGVGAGLGVLIGLLIARK